MDWSCENYCDVFISCLDSGFGFWRHPFTTKNPLVISSNLFQWRNKLIYIFDVLRVGTLSFWVNCYFKEWISYLDHNHEATSFPICYQHSIYSLYIYCMWFMYVVTDLCFSGVSLEPFRMWDPTYICNKHWINKKLSSYITSLKFLISFDEIVPSDSSILQLPF